MRENVQRQVYNAILLVLRPIARALLAVGISYREFAEIAKTAFVDTATQDYGLRGRPTNISRVAVMTGLTRKEVKRIRVAMEDSPFPMNTKRPPAATILHRWYTDSRFTDDKALPLRLPFDGEGASFTQLVRMFGGDVPPGAMRKELERLGALDVGEDGSLYPLKRKVGKIETHERLAGMLSTILYPTALNCLHNLKDPEKKEWWTNLLIHSDSLRESDVTGFRRVATDRVDDFARSLDDLLASYEAVKDVNDDSKKSSSKTVGVGVFYFEDESGDTANFG